MKDKVSMTADGVGVKWVVSGEIMAVEFRQNIYNVCDSRIDHTCHKL